MPDPLTALDWLGEVFATTNQRIAVTVVAVGLLLAVLVASQRLQAAIDARMRALYVDVVVAVVLIGTCLLTVSVTLGVWGLTEEIPAVLSRYDLGGDVLARGVVSFVLVVTAYIVSRFARRLLRDVLDPAANVSDHQQEITHRLSQVLIWAFTLVVVLGIWVDDLGGLLVGAGFLGIVLGMAARQTLGSMLAGFVLMFSRPFEIGDWIEVDDYHGIVTDISIFDTRIQSFGGENVVVPNDVVGSSVVTNRTRRGRLRVEIEVGVDYRTDVERAAELAEEAVSNLDQAMSVPRPRTVTKSFGDSAIVLGVRFWIENPSARRMWEARTEGIGAIKRTFEREGIKIPYPQRELSGREETDGFRVNRQHLAYDEGDTGRDAVDRTERPRDRGARDAGVRDAGARDASDREPAARDAGATEGAEAGTGTGEPREPEAEDR